VWRHATPAAPPGLDVINIGKPGLTPGGYILPRLRRSYAATRLSSSAAAGKMQKSWMPQREPMAALRFHIIPNAKTDAVIGSYGDAIKVKLRAPAVEGKANAALRCFLAEELGIPKHAIVLEHGHKSRDKVIRIEGLSAADVRQRLLATT